MIYKKIHLNIITFLLAVLIITGVYMILYRTHDIFKKPSPIVTETASKTTDASYITDFAEERKVTPSRPEDLGITVYYEDEEPKTQEEWNAFVANSYKVNRREFENNYKGEFGPSPYRQLDEADLKEIETNRTRIDEKISEYEKQLKNNPDDETSKERLKNWRKFKALLVAVYGEKSNEE